MTTHGRPLLVNLTFSRPWDNMGNLGVLSGLCVDLHPYCTLEVAGIHFDPTNKLLVCAFFVSPSACPSLL